MNPITVDKADLLSKIRANRDQHRKIFLEALEGYKKTVLAELEEFIADIKAGKIRRVYIDLPRPEDHTFDYDRVIGMLEMDKATEIQLDELTYRRYVQDDWQWKRSFLASNRAYSGTATMAFAAAYPEEADEVDPVI